MSKLQRSRELFKAAWRVVRGHRKLLLFPIILSLMTFLITLFFLMPLAFWNTGHDFTQAVHWKALAALVATWSEESGPTDVSLNMAGYAVIAGLYLVSMFTATFVNVAFFNEILHALNGQPVSVRGGLRFAMTRLKAITAWALLTGLVGLIIKSLEERVGLIGRWIVRLIGVAWSVASVFAIPVIVREEKHANPVLFLKTSAGILRRTWGESLAGYIGIRFANGLGALLTAIVFLIAFYLGHVNHSFWIPAGITTVWILVFMLFSMFLNVLSEVYRGALFIYATEGVVPGPFEKDQMDLAWEVASGRKAR